MKNFYRKDEKILSIKDLELNDNMFDKISFDEITLNKDVLYYENFFNTFRRFSDDNQTLTREEAYDIIHHEIDETKDIEKLKRIKLLFIDTANKFPIEITKQERKDLKRQKRLRKLRKK